MTASIVRPVRLQLTRRDGFRLQAHSYSINGLPGKAVARPSKWGNPYSVVRAGFSRLVGMKFVFEWYVFCDGVVVEVFQAKDAALKCAVGLYEGVCVRPGAELANEALRELRGMNLGCWCPLPAKGEPDVCHAEVLLRVANDFD